MNKLDIIFKFKQNFWLKSHTGLNTDLWKKAKYNFEKYFLKFLNNAVFEKIMENIRKPRDIRLVTTETRRNCLLPEPSYHSTKFFLESLLAIEMKKKSNILE